MATKLVAECTECDTVFRMQDFKEDSPNDSCKCKNIEVGIKKVKNNRYPFYFTVTYSKTRPKIYELND
jgi:hypothetical protein